MPDPLDHLSDVVRSHRGALVALARSEGLTAEEAVECVQDALCTYLTHLPDAPGDTDWAIASVRTMVRNAARNARRRHHRAKPHEPIADELAAGAEDAESVLAHAEDIVRLRVCVAELCSVQRAVVMLRFLEERSGEDVAAALGLTRSHVDVLVHRAKASLRVCLRHGG